MPSYAPTKMPITAADMLNEIEYTKTKVSSPRTNGIGEHLHKMILQEFYQVTLRKSIYPDSASLQVDLDQWLAHYNTGHTPQGKMCCGRTPLETLQDGKRIWQEKLLN